MLQLHSEETGKPGKPSPFVAWLLSPIVRALLGDSRDGFAAILLFWFLGFSIDIFFDGLIVEIVQTLDKWAIGLTFAHLTAAYLLEIYSHWRGKIPWGSGRGGMNVICVA